MKTFWGSRNELTSRQLLLLLKVFLRRVSSRQFLSNVFQRMLKDRGWSTTRWRAKRKKRIFLAVVIILKLRRVASRAFATEMRGFLSFTSLTLDDYKIKLQNISNCKTYLPHKSTHTFLRLKMVAECVCTSASAEDIERPPIYLINT